jgi:glycosyltransferase involved in cell wall biosynthesis
LDEKAVTRYIVAGHFGSTLSYATISKEISKALARWNMLAGTINFDDSYRGFDPVRIKEGDMASARLLCVSLPSHHIEQLAQHFGAARSVLYMSPNTDTLSAEAKRVSWAFGGLITPSQFCEDTLLRATGRLSERVPLGVGSPFLVVHKSNARRLAARLDGPPKILHMSTDGFLPGRKGTEALIDGIYLARPSLPPGTKFTFHLLPKIQFDVRTLVAERGLDDIIDVVAGNARGVTDDELVSLISEHDVVIQPSRCEGYGITQLLPLAMGTPLVTTFSTGMTEFLYHFRGCWMPVRHDAMALLSGEDGMSPKIAPGELAEVLTLAASRTMRESALHYQSLVTDQSRFSWQWSECADRWLDAMETSFSHR